MVEGVFAARKPMKRKRAKKRRDSRPRCDRNRCTKPARVTLEDGGWCVTHAKQLADNLCRAIVLDRDDYTCQKCGASKDGRWAIQWAHIITRSELSIRWNPLNSMALCSKDHMAFGYDPEGWHDWIEFVYAPGRMAALRVLRRESIARGDKPDYAEIIASLRSQAASL